MTFSFILLLIVFALVFIQIIFFQITKRVNIDKGYVKVDSLLTPTEHNFYVVLQKQISKYHIIQCKVRLEDIIIVTAVQNRNSMRGRIKSRHIDFTICDKATLKPLYCIELDDSSHNRPDRIERDTFINNLFEDVKIPLLRVSTKDMYKFKLSSYKLNI